MELKRECDLTDEVLIDKCYQWISDLCKTGGMAWTLRVPVDMERDPDILFTELISRYKCALAKNGSNTVLCGEGHNEAVIVNGDNTITNDQNQTTTLTTPNGLLPAEGSDLTVCDGIRGYVVWSLLIGFFLLSLAL